MSVHLIAAGALQRHDLIATGPQSAGTVAYLTEAGEGRVAIVLVDGATVVYARGDKVAVLK